MRPDNQKPSIDGVRPTAPVTPPVEPAAQPQPQMVPAEEPRTPDQKPSLDPKPIADEPGTPKKRSLRKKIVYTLLGLVIAAASLLAGAFIWYQQQLSPASSDTEKRIRVTIEQGATPAGIAQLLESSGVIRSQTAFAIYTKLTNTQNSLKAGVYNLQPSISTPAIVGHLVDGKQDTFRITFLPGDTLMNNRKKLIKVGFTDEEIDAAFNKTYDRPLFAGKPADADLEGYIFGETYEFTPAATVETILNRTFDEYEAAIKEYDLVNGFKKQGLTLFQGITLASIVQREALGAEDQRQIARVFLNRMEAGMTLGSDVTYQYIADKMGVQRDVNLDSPYNTRLYKGLTPGPIASPGIGALRGVSNPGSNDYLFFLSGDDDVTYFAKTDAEHQQNIVKHCQKKCLII